MNIRSIAVAATSLLIVAVASFQSVSWAEWSDTALGAPSSDPALTAGIPIADTSIKTPLASTSPPLTFSRTSSGQSSPSTYRAIEDDGEAENTAPVRESLDTPTDVSLRTADGSAAAGQDYASIPTTLSFPASISRQTPIEEITVAFDRRSYRVNEDAGEVYITVTMSEPLDSPADVRLQTSDGTARHTWDYVPVSRIVTFPANTTRRTITVRIINDQALEHTQETFSVSLESIPGSGLAVNTSPATVTIVDDDEAIVQIELSEYRANEKGPFVIVFEVVGPGSCPSPPPFDVHFSYDDPWGALSSTSLSIQFNPCDRRRAINFQVGNVTGDSVVLFTLDRVTSSYPGVASRIKIGNSRATLTIVERDGIEITVRSRPAGRTVKLNGSNRIAPFTTIRRFGDSNTLDVPSPQRARGVDSRYVFSRWSQGGPRSQTVYPRSNTTYTAIFNLQHFLSTRSEPGGAGVPGGGKWYDHNSIAYVGPAPNKSGCEFSHWRQRGRTIGDNPAGVRVIVDGPALVEAVYVPEKVNSPPSIARFSPSSASITLSPGDELNFEATATDPDSDISSWRWSVNGRSTRRLFVQPTGQSSSTFERPFPYKGTYRVTATFTDASSAVAFHTWTVQVVPSAQEVAPDVKRLTPRDEDVSLYTTQNGRFYVSAKDANGNLDKWEWEARRKRSFWGIPLPDYVYTPAEQSISPLAAGSVTRDFSYPFQTRGNWTVTATFTDSDGKSGSVAWAVEVRDGPDLALYGLEITNNLTPHLGPGSFFFVEMQMRNNGPVASGEYEVSFYLKNTAPRYVHLRRERRLERGFDEDDDILLTILAKDPSGPSLYNGERRRVASTSVDIPDDLKAGPYWLCSQIEHRSPTRDPIPDPKDHNNADCTLTYVVSSLEVAEWVYPVAPDFAEVLDYEDAGRFWIGVPHKIFKVSGIKEEYSFKHAAATNPEKRIALYRDVALEIASRKALIETEEHLVMVELKNLVDQAQRDSAVFEKIFSLYQAVHDVSGGKSGLPSIAGIALVTADSLLEGFDLYVAILINRAINIDNALATLDVLEKMDMENEYDGQASEWRLGVSMARDHVLALADASAWEHAFLAAKDLAFELISSGAKLVLGVLGKAGVVVKGVALGSAAVGAKIYAIFAILSAVAALVDHWDNLAMSLMAAQVYVELYESDARGDILEVLTYAKYVVYDRAYQAEDNWLASLGAFLRFSSTEEFKEEAATLRETALEEAKAAARVASIEFEPAHYQLEVGDVVELSPKFISGSGKQVIGFGVEWTNYAGVHESVDLDVESMTVTARAPGGSTVVASIGDVHGRVTFTVTAPTTP